MISWWRHEEQSQAFDLPSAQLVGKPPIVWLTDLEEPDVDGLGLSKDLIRCDRTEVRFEVDPANAMRWADYQKLRRPNREWVVMLQYGDRCPAHWFVSERPLPVIGERVTLPGADDRAKA